MDTAQRGMGLDWPNALELIRRSAAAAKADGHRMLASGAGTDHLDPAAAKSVDDVIRAYEEQFEAVEAAGSPIILMASRALVRVARSADDYLHVYDRLLAPGARAGDHPLARRHVRPAARRLLGLGRHADRDGDGARRDPRASGQGRRHQDLAARRAPGRSRCGGSFPPACACMTGDDFNFAELIAGDEEGHSDALLGIFDAIAPAASAALSRLAAGDEAGFHDILAPTVPLSRLIFAAPTRFYKTGVVFLAWLNGHQDHFTMVGGQESARSILHLAEVFRLADQARPLPRSADSPPSACERSSRSTGSPDACATSPPTRRFEHLSLNTATVREAGRSPRDHRGGEAARHLLPLALARPGRRRSGSTARCKAVRDGGFRLSGYCRGGMFPADAGAPRARCSTTTAAPSTRRRRSARHAWCSSSAACRNSRGPDRRRRRTSPARARRWSDAIAALLDHANAAGVDARDRAAASDVCRRPRLREHARPGARHLRPARPGRRAPARRRDRRLSRLVGPGGAARRSRAPAHARIHAFHICDWLVPTRDLLLDRGMMGDGVIEIRKLRAAVEAQGFAGPCEVEIFSRRLVGAADRRGARDDDRALPHRLLTS